MSIVIQDIDAVKNFFKNTWDKKQDKHAFFPNNKHEVCSFTSNTEIGREGNKATAC